MSFPLLFTVTLTAYVKDGGEDSQGNEIPGWADPVEHRVFGWGAPQSSEPKLAGHDRVVVDVELLVPPGFECGPYDRIDLDGKTYEVVGEVESYGHSPFGWNPGGVVNLQRVDG